MSVNSLVYVNMSYFHYLACRFITNEDLSSSKTDIATAYSTKHSEISPTSENIQVHDSPESIAMETSSNVINASSPDVDSIESNEEFMDNNKILISLLDEPEIIDLTQ